MKEEMTESIKSTTVKIHEGISLFTACKNRGENLEKALKTWLRFPEIDEIILVDWASDLSLEPLVERYQDGRIVLAVVSDQEKWILTQAFNLAARLTTCDKIFKIDADVEILTGFFEQHILQPGIFYAGNWINQRNENEQYLNGMVYLYRDDFFRVNGYNEFIQMYGWDDDDLYGRLQAQGLKRVDISNDTLHHIEHEHRTIHQDATRALFSLPDSERAVIQILMNRYISRQMEPWSSKQTMRDFRMEQRGDNHILCDPLIDDNRVIPPELWEISRVVAVKDRMNQLGFSLLPEIFSGDEDGGLEKLYRLYISDEKGGTVKTVLHAIENKLHHYSQEAATHQQLLKSVERELKAVSADFEVEKERVVNLEDQINQLHRSWTWRIGRVLVSIIAVPLRLFLGLVAKKRR